LFAEAPTRVEYLSLLTGRKPPGDVEAWRNAKIDAIIASIDGAAVLPADEQERITSRLDRSIARARIPLSAADLKTLTSFRGQFVKSGLSLVFQVRGQPVRSYYPTLRTLLRETDRSGRQRGFLATESGYQFLRSLQAQDRIVPVVGDFSGTRAMRAIAADMTSRGLKLAAFYTSNVEYYLFRAGTFAAYTENLQRLPHDERSRVIRSVFPSGGSRSLPHSVPGYYSTSLVQPFAAMLEEVAAGKYRTYQALTTASIP